jgi:serine/threonine protein kinase
MSVPSSYEELLVLIRKSGMIDEAKLTAVLDKRHAGRGMPPDPRDAADLLVAEGVLTNFQAEQFLLGKWRGFTLGKYKLLERIGVGGMGQVFLCEHMFMKRRVAVKVLPPAKADQPAALGRFYREARAAGSIQHSNIVRTHDIDQDGNLHFIVMEYVDGSNLLDVVKKFGKMDIGRVVSYMRQVALGLEYAFKNGIIHRDIKPGNILINRRGKAQILDMGLARFFNDQNDNLTVKYDDKIVLGTADYVAPEQVANSHSVDTRADVYALGATTYFLLAGHPPFPSGTVSQKLLWHRTKDPTPIQQVRPDCPDALAAIVTKMMAKDPKNRYQTAGEVAAELEKLMPAKVVLPAEVEMPVLSPAAASGNVEVEPDIDAEAEEETVPMAVAATPEPALAAVGAGVAMAGATATRRVAEPAAFAPNGSSVVDLRSQPLSRPSNPFAANVGVGGNPFSNAPPASPWESPDDFRGGNPFSHHGHAPTAVDELTPVNGHRNRDIRATTVFAPPPPRDQVGNASRQIALYALLGASLVIALGFVGWKFFLK